MRDNVSERDKWRFFALANGLFWSWVAIYMMIQSVYQGLQQTIEASIHGGTYRLGFMRAQSMAIWFVLIFVTSFLLTYGLLAEKKETSTGT